MTAAGPDVKHQLLESARELFIEVGFDAASIKKIAARAKVNPAMVSYYFGSKEGLSQEMLADAVAPMLESLKELGSCRPEGASLGDFIIGYRRAVTANPWLPKLIVREVLPENGRLRDLFVEQFASRAAKMVKEIVGNEIKTGNLREGLDHKLLIISLISLTIFPFLAAPILEPVMKIKVTDPAFIRRLNFHSIDLLTHGVERRTRT